MSRRSEKGTVEQSLGIAIHDLKRAGILAANSATIATWTRGNKALGSIGIACLNRTQILMHYVIKAKNGRNRTQSFIVELNWTTCHLGGERPWFKCPACNRPVARLYPSDETGRFSCRICARLNYQSQRQTRACRLIDRAHRLRGELGATGGLFAPPPHKLIKPKHMRWVTFYNKALELLALEQTIVFELSSL